MAKKVPIRKCVGCGERKDKRELIRIVYNKENNNVSIDKTGKISGRGAYICPEKECLKKVQKGNRLARSLKISISDDVYNNLMEEIDIMKD